MPIYSKAVVFSMGCRRTATAENVTRDDINQVVAPKPPAAMILLGKSNWLRLVI